MVARERGLEGVVVLSVLDDAALAAVRTWVFAPATRGGRPVESIVEVPVKFALRAP